MADYIQCPNEECMRVIHVPWELKYKAHTCPHCSFSLFCDPKAIRTVEDGTPPPDTIPIPMPQGKPVTTLELASVGQKVYVLGAAQVQWFEINYLEEERTVLVISHSLPIMEYRREDRVNFCKFRVPEYTLLYYQRNAQSKPRITEMRFFRLENGQFIDLGEINQVFGSSYFIKRFITPQYGQVSVRFI